MVLQEFRVSLRARFEVLTAVLMALPRTLRCYTMSPSIYLLTLNKYTASVFRINEDGSTKFLQKISKYLPVNMV
jgi:hypothetical protein